MPHVVGEPTPDHHVLRLNLRDLMGVLADRGRRVYARWAASSRPDRHPHNPGLGGLGSRMIRWRVRWYWYVVAIALPLAVVGLTVGLNVALGASVTSLAGVGSVTTVLMMFAVRLVNPGDGALGEEPGWRGFALPGLQSTLSPLVSTLILGVLVTIWHVPILFLEEGQLRPQFVVGFLLRSMAVTS